jgi:hypothetical protein
MPKGWPKKDQISFLSLLVFSFSSCCFMMMLWFLVFFPLSLFSWSRELFKQTMEKIHYWSWWIQHTCLSTCLCTVAVYSAQNLSCNSSQTWRTQKYILLHRLDFSFAPQAVHGVPNSFLKWSEPNAQINQFLGANLGPHDPALFVLLDSDGKGGD